MSENTVKLMQGNEACVEGAIAAGMRFYAGYPITPSTEIAELSAEKLPRIGGKFIQMEDEIASISAIIGASLAGKKSMTATSGPGFSLKQEGIGYAVMAEIPCVIVNVQRGGPSTGLPTSPAQGDIMQARWGTHGDHSIIALYPSTVREIYDTTIKAFNFAEKYRTPVILLMDEVIAHMREKVKIPDKDEITVINRKKPNIKPDEYLPYKVEENDFVPAMANFGEGYRYHVTGLVHDETGFPTSNHHIAENLVNRLVNKIEDNIEDIVEYEEYQSKDAEEIIVAYGATARSVKSAIDVLRKEGIKIGLFRPITIWPIAEKQLKEISKKVNKITVIEMNMGQYFNEVDRIAGKDTKVNKYNRVNGELITPEEIVSFIKEG
ncbi:2-oxoglutarate ferredoxin oxidoreductase subunit alpha [Keratinibaculum paraultunense]|uniref:2-oxoglutarate ferredoxin oxidoreductase subunit alpha n=1 Tax=Keratinibaculum paraultunense TaxID=1278232 RepID=A0A4R3L2D7_9FIRM|nr:2-oxoacid:acceptor oxidoreductase subunit alpha [Keratinibaculum paraultunense]QQY80646.1 2-oxoacid:acceptor oxidoreductase subunit alpha [Keratinibaculum paraultunense]TCS91381.1 2-oxoglutarate ferredoxin oxidoreductase subunit alpha [Keratinibaculum paraultunense]